MEYQEIEGDLIKLALEGKFDVITHGCNCMCTMGAGIAPQMAKTFGCDKFDLENIIYQGDINKLGQIEHRNFYIKNNKIHFLEKFNQINLSVVNSYTQMFPGKPSPGCQIPLDYEALTLCLRKINYIFKGKHIGLPLIGCGLAGGDWNLVKKIIQNELKDMEITVVHYKK